MSVYVGNVEFAPAYVRSVDQGVSEDARSLRRLLLGEDFFNPGSGAEGRTGLRRALGESIAAAKAAGVLATGQAVGAARSLIDVLPDHVPDPAIVLEEDGHIAFDWYEDSDRVMTINVDPLGQLGYSALIGLQPDYGSSPFTGAIPQTVLFNLLRMYPVPPKPRRH